MGRLKSPLRLGIVTVIDSPVLTTVFSPCFSVLLLALSRRIGYHVGCSSSSPLLSFSETGRMKTKSFTTCLRCGDSLALSGCSRAERNTPDDSPPDGPISDRSMTGYRSPNPPIPTRGCDAAEELGDLGHKAKKAVPALTKLLDDDIWAFAWRRPWPWARSARTPRPQFRGSPSRSRIVCQCSRGCLYRVSVKSVATPNRSCRSW